MSDRILGIVAVIAGLAYAFAATGIQTSFLADPVGPKTFPMLLGGVGALCGVLIALKPDRPGPEWPGARTWGALAVAVAVLVGYAYALKPLGFLIPTAIAASVLSWQIRPHVVRAILTGIGLSLGLFALFRFALGLSLAGVPRGWLS